MGWPGRVSIPDSPFTYVCYELTTGAYIGRLPLSGVQFGSQLLQPGSASGTLDIASQAVQNLGPLNLTAPATRVLGIDYLGSLLWGGVIWPRDYSYDSESRKLQVTATELWSYPAARMQATGYSAPPYSGLTGPSEYMPIWDATKTSVPEGGAGVYDATLIAWQILYDALWQVKFGNILGGVGIAANGFTTPSAYLASGTATNPTDYLAINYPYESLQQVGSIVNMLASNGYGVGFDYAIDVAYSRGQMSPPVATINLSYPRRGRGYSFTGLTLNMGSAIKYAVPEDGTQTANTVYEMGSSNAIVVSQNINPLQAGYPLLEQLKSRSNIQSPVMLTVLSQLGIADLATGAYPVSTPSVTMDLFSSSVPLGEFIVGDDVRWIIPRSNGKGDIFDPRFPNGLDEEWRITGYQATVADDGQSTIQFTLALPPSVELEGPMI